MRISDWSSDVCSSYLTAIRDDISENLDALDALETAFAPDVLLLESGGDNLKATFSRGLVDVQIFVIDVAGYRKSDVSGKSVSVRVDLGGGCILKKKTTIRHYSTFSINKTRKIS